MNKNNAYLTNHGMGPGTIPRDVRVEKWIDLPNFKTVLYLDRELTNEEMGEFELKSVLICCFCEAIIEDYGHNPEPLKNHPERCCENCNMNTVIPERIRIENVRKVITSDILKDILF